MNIKLTYMQAALEEARKAYDKGEIPIGAVLVKDGTIIARAHNQNRETQNPTRHAEIIAIEEACRCLGNERLTDTELYVTKEPCAMCAGAIVHARVKRLIIGAGDPRYGACGTVLSICGNPLLNHEPEIEFGLLEEESAQLLKSFFREKRKGPSARKTSFGM